MRSTGVVVAITSIRPSSRCPSSRWSRIGQHRRCQRFGCHLGRLLHERQVPALRHSGALSAEQHGGKRLADRVEDPEHQVLDPAALRWQQSHVAQRLAQDRDRSHPRAGCDRGRRTQQPPEQSPEHPRASRHFAAPRSPAGPRPASSRPGASLPASWPPTSSPEASWPPTSSPEASSRPGASPEASWPPTSCGPSRRSGLLGRHLRLLRARPLRDRGLVGGVGTSAAAIPHATNPKRLKDWRGGTSPSAGAHGLGGQSSSTLIPKGSIGGTDRTLGRFVVNITIDNCKQSVNDIDVISSIVSPDGSEAAPNPACRGRTPFVLGGRVEPSAPCNPTSRHTSVGSRTSWA